MKTALIFQSSGTDSSVTSSCSKSNIWSSPGELDVQLYFFVYCNFSIRLLLLCTVVVTVGLDIL